MYVADPRFTKTYEDLAPGLAQYVHDHPRERRPARRGLSLSPHWPRLACVTGHDGLFIAFEGGDGAGKSTQVRLLAQALRARGYAVRSPPAGTELGAAIRDLVLHGDHVSPRAEALLFAADKAHHVDQLVRPALERGEVVLTDRYTDSSVAYQGAGRDLGAAEVHDLQMWAVRGLVPDLTVIVDITAAARAAAAGAAPTTGSSPRPTPSTRPFATTSSRWRPSTRTATSSSTARSPGAPARAGARPTRGDGPRGRRPGCCAVSVWRDVVVRRWPSRRWSTR